MQSRPPCLSLQNLLMTSTLPNSDRFFHPALDSLEVGIWSWDIPSSTIVCSTEWMRIRGYGDQLECPDSPQELLALVHADDRERVRDHRQRLISGRAENHALIYRTLHSAGTEIWVEERVRTVRNANGAVIRLVACEIDITSRQQNERTRTDWRHAERSQKKERGGARRSPAINRL